MTGYKSKKAAAQAKLEDDDTQVYQTELTKLLMESYDKGVADALAEIKAAQDKMAQPAQEPVAWLAGAERERKTYALSKTLTQDIDAPLTLNGVALWPKRPWVGLTDEEIAAFDWSHAVVDAECVRAIEAKLKEKNNG